MFTLELCKPLHYNNTGMRWQKLDNETLYTILMLPKHIIQSFYRVPRDSVQCRIVYHYNHLSCLLDNLLRTVKDRSSQPRIQNITDKMLQKFIAIVLINCMRSVGSLGKTVIKSESLPYDQIGIFTDKSDWWSDNRGFYVNVTMYVCTLCFRHFFILLIFTYNLSRLELSRISTEKQNFRESFNIKWQ